MGAEESAEPKTEGEPNKTWSDVVRLVEELSRLQALMIEEFRRSAKLLEQQRAEQRDQDLWYCAQSAMNGLLVRGNSSPDEIAARAFQTAEAMMAERERQRAKAQAVIELSRSSVET